jgi:hypothetical protein
LTGRVDTEPGEGREKTVATQFACAIFCRIITRIRIRQTDKPRAGKERNVMRTYLSLFLCLCVAASVGLVACAKKEAPPPPPAEETAPADNAAMAPSEAMEATKEAAEETGKEAMEAGKESMEAGKEGMDTGKKAVEGAK